MTEKTHYRKAFNSPYLSSADIVEPTTLTIARVTLEGDRTRKTKDVFNTAYFAEKELRPGEPLKPMILNAHNSKVLKDLAGSHFIEDWKNIAVTIYVDSNVRFGRDTVEGLRISPNQPIVKKEIQPNTPAWGHAKNAYIRDGNFEKVLSRASISQENMDKIKAEVENANTSQS
jgi:hypothetical protein